MIKISAVIIVYNEEKYIQACLETLKPVVDEIVIVDSGSTDNTTSICKQYTENITTQLFKGFGPQKQIGISNASHEWILQLDADERLSVNLQQELLELKKIINQCVLVSPYPFICIS